MKFHLNVAKPCLRVKIREYFTSDIYGGHCERATLKCNNAAITRLVDYSVLCSRPKGTFTWIIQASLLRRKSKTMKILGSQLAFIFTVQKQSLVYN